MLKERAEEQLRNSCLKGKPTGSQRTAKGKLKEHKRKANMKLTGS